MKSEQLFLVSQSTTAIVEERSCWIIFPDIDSLVPLAEPLDPLRLATCHAALEDNSDSLVDNDPRRCTAVKGDQRCDPPRDNNGWSIPSDGRESNYEKTTFVRDTDGGKDQREEGGTREN